MDRETQRWERDSIYFQLIKNLFGLRDDREHGSVVLFCVCVCECVCVSVLSCFPPSCDTKSSKADTWDSPPQSGPKALTLSGPLNTLWPPQSHSWHIQTVMLLSWRGRDFSSSGSSGWCAVITNAHTHMEMWESIQSQYDDNERNYFLPSCPPAQSWDINLNDLDKWAKQSLTGIFNDTNTHAHTRCEPCSLNSNAANLWSPFTWQHFTHKNTVKKICVYMEMLRDWKMLKYV